MVPAECLLIQVDLLKLTCLSCARGIEKETNHIIRLLSNTTGFLKQSQDSDHLHLLKNFKHHFQQDLLQKHALGCKIENAPDLGFLGEKKCSLDNQFFLKYNVCVCCYLVSLLLNGTLLSGPLERIMQQSYCSETF